MSNPYLDGDTISLCHQALRDGATLESIAGKLHYADTEYLGRLLQLPTVRPVATDATDLWREPELDGVL